MLSREQILQYARDGFLVVPDFVSRESCETLRERAFAIVDVFEPCTDETVFSSDRPDEVLSAQFLASSTGMWCWFDDDDVDGSRRDRVARIGHAMHDLDPVFERFTYTLELAVVAAELGLTDAAVVHSSYRVTRPGTNRMPACRQDATFFYTDPISVTGFWFAIDDATVENGCLWVAPGGHRTSLRNVLMRAGDPPWDGYETGVSLEVVDPTPLPAAPDDLVPLEVPAGSMIVRHGLLPYWHDANRSASARHSFVVHCVSSNADYPEWNWLQRPEELPLRRLDDVAAPDVDELIAAFQADLL